MLDGQVLQGPAFLRGLGRYSLSLIRSLATRPGLSVYSSYRLLFSSSMPFSSELKAALSTIASATVDMVNLRSASTGYVAAAEANRAQVDSYVAALGGDVDFVIPALFHHAAPVFPTACRRVLIFYDLIPLLFHKEYLPAHSPETDDYLGRLPELMRADLVCTDSQSAADDLVAHLGVESSRVVNIGGAPFDSGSRPLSASPALPPRPYVLFPSDDDIRKNNETTIRAFERLRAQLDHPLHLVVTSSFRPGFRAHLESLSRHVHFTGHVSDAYLMELYSNCEAVVFSSLYEGLGLPILEAAQFERPVVCSDLPVFREISDRAFYWCTPEDEVSIATAIGDALASRGWDEKRGDYPVIRERFTWDRTADRFLQALAAYPVRPLRPGLSRPRLAVVGPTPEGYSAIGRVMAELHPTLSRSAEIHYFLEQGPDHRAVRPNVLLHCTNAWSADLGGWNYPEFDAFLYHIGNSTYHLDTVRLALHLPGYLVLHDTFLAGLFERLAHYGVVDSERLALEERIERELALEGGHYVASLLSRQLGLVVHSRWSEELAETATSGRVPIVRLNLPVPEPPLLPATRKAPPTIALGGIMAQEKGIDLMLSLARRRELADCRCEVFGFALSDPQHLASLFEESRIHLLLDLTDLEFQKRLTQIHVLLNYRTKYHGEASRSVLDAMRHGVAVVVRNIGWYSELPDDVVFKTDSVEDAMDAVAALVEDEGKRKEMGRRARRYVSAHHSIRQYVDGIMQLTERPPGELGNALRCLLLTRPTTARLVESAASIGDHPSQSDRLHGRRN